MVEEGKEDRERERLAQDRDPLERSGGHVAEEVVAAASDADGGSMPVDLEPREVVVGEGGGGARGSCHGFQVEAGILPERLRNAASHRVTSLGHQWPPTRPAMYSSESAAA